MDMRLVYVLLDGVGDLPHPSIDNTTPLQGAHTPNLDKLVSNGSMGRVISVGEGIAPESDIAVFNMLGYNFQKSEYVGRGVVESVGVGIDFKDGDLALRGNFATLNNQNFITDRRAGRHIERQDADTIAKEIESNIKFSDPNTTVSVVPTIGHRVVVRFRTNNRRLSSNISNTDPAYARVDGMGIAKTTHDDIKISKCNSEEDTEDAKFTATVINEFNSESLRIMSNSEINLNRRESGEKGLDCILLRDAGNMYPTATPINTKYSMKFSSIVDMPVEIGISKILDMKMYESGGLTDYEAKAQTAAYAMREQNAIYIHIKGPDEFGHDGDAIGKLKNIEEIDKRFFGVLLQKLDMNNTNVVVSADHSTPCINKGHSDDPVPLLVSGNNVTNDNTTRYTECDGEKGSIGLLRGVQVLETAIKLIKSEK